MNTHRCINIDWLEVYAVESSIGFPHDADFFRNAGWHVVEREYGTRTYKQMFTLYDTENHPLIEIRRAPKSSWNDGKGGVLDPYGCHIRLTNRSCYMDDAAGLMQQFLQRYMYSLSRISRIDLCLDFEKFDTGDDPQKFLDRYINKKYSKINQARIGLNGLDRWDGRYWNSVRWGNENSMVSTKFYDKTMELAEVKDKPYIRQAWFLAGLVDDWFDLTKKQPNGEAYKPRIWRLEFSIKSSTKNWFVVEDPYSTRKKLRSIRHTLDQYHTRAQLLDVFFSLADHYFHFKYVEYINDTKTLAKSALSAVALDTTHKLVKGTVERKLQRKDRCADKVLFRNCRPSTFYKIAHVATEQPSDIAAKRLERALMAYRATTIEPSVHKAIDTILEALQVRMRIADASHPMHASELTLLRQLVAHRIKNNYNALLDDLNAIKALMTLDDEIFYELP